MSVILECDKCKVQQCVKELSKFRSWPTLMDGWQVFPGDHMLCQACYDAFRALDETLEKQKEAALKAWLGGLDMKIKFGELMEVEGQNVE